MCIDYDPCSSFLVHKQQYPELFWGSVFANGLACTYTIAKTRASTSDS
jgi:hypothetical protein